MDSFIKDNAKWLLTVVFAAGILYAEFTNFKNVEERLSKKIRVISHLEDEMHDLENRIIVLETKEKNETN